MSADVLSGDASGDGPLGGEPEPDLSTGGGHDLRLAAPAVGAWSAALVLLGLGAAAAYVTAAVSTIGAIFLGVRTARDRMTDDAHLTPGPERPAEAFGVGRPPILAAGTVRERVTDDAGLTAISECPAEGPGAGGPRISAVGQVPAVRWMSAARRFPGVRWVPVGRWMAAMRRFSELRRAPAESRARVARRVLAGTLACVAASAVGVGLRLTAVGSGSVRALAVRGATVWLGAVVTGDPAVLKAGQTRRRDTVLVPARVEEVEFALGMTRRRRVRVPVLLLADDPAWRPLVPSQRVRLTARLVTPRHGELLAAVGLVRGPPALVGRPSLPQRWASTIRSRLRTAASRLPADQRGVLPGLVDGDTSLLDPELADAFEAAGLTHLMAVSGENLSLLIGAVLMAGRFTGLGRRAVPLLAGLTVFGFVLVARPSPSVLRAAVMGSVALLAVVTARERRGVPALCAAVLVLVLLDPELARSYGFALSTLATAGILVLGPPWRRCLTRWLPRSVPGRLLRRMVGALAEPLAVSTAAHVACAPVLVLLDGEVSLVAVPANLLAAPAVGPATLLGVLAAAVAPGSLPLARLIVLPAGLAVGWITGVARLCARAPYAAIDWLAAARGVSSGVCGRYRSWSRRRDGAESAASVICHSMD
ncbi:ComEC/Rec2 family competence protein, partial [Actinoallomurus sp. NPDC052274]|uniref:ComEC/Rec2 family competence protein n=1 Tax=Actinoallomurus sp. NPDC052274 TaxID=3155420 RepID=UPI00341B7C6D